MLKLTTLAAAAALLLTTQAQAASITVVLTGKSPEQVRTEIASAAHTVCVRETAFELERLMAIRSCEKDTNAKAMAEAQTKMAKMKAGGALAAR